MFVLFTDTDTDITPSVAKEYGYHLISMPYYIEEKETKPYEDFEVFDSHSYYNLLRSGVLPMTGGLSPETYKQYFEPFFKEGKDILYVHFSAAMSSTFGAMKIALDELKEDYPERKLYQIDCKAITTLCLPMVLAIGKMYKEGKSIEELLEYGEKEVNHYAIYFLAENLTFFKRSGRVGALPALMGNMIGLKPIMYMNSEGKMMSVDKARGRLNAIQKILDYMDKLGDHISDYPVYIGHTDCKETAELITSKIKEKYGEKTEVIFVDVNPTAGAHCGPDAVGVCFHCTKRGVND